MSQELNALILEIKRLSSLTREVRENEGVYADTTQLKFLLRQLSASGSKPSILNGVDKFISDLAGSDSEILKLMDRLRASQNA